MLFPRFSLMALVAFGSMSSGRLLARRLPENRGLKIKAWTKDVVQRDYPDEIAAAISSEGITGNPQNDVGGDIYGSGDNTLIEGPKEISLGPSSDSTTGDQQNEVGGDVSGSGGDTQIEVSNGNPSDYDMAYRPADAGMQVNIDPDAIEARDEMRQGKYTYVLYRISEPSAGVKTMVVDVKSASKDWEDFFYALQRQNIGYAIHVLPNHRTLFITNLLSEETDGIGSILASVAGTIAGELGDITDQSVVNDFATLHQMDMLYAPCFGTGVTACPHPPKMSSG